MKKLLLLLLCVPLLFSNCNKDDDTPDNNNNNNGTATFLESQDGSVWELQANWEDGVGFWDNDDGVGCLYWDQIGFYESNDNFMLGKMTSQSNEFFCQWYNQEGTQGHEGIDITLVKNTANTLWMEYTNNDEYFIKVQNKWTLISDNQLSVVTDVYWNDSIDYDYFSAYEAFYIRSTTQTNLTCQ